MKIVAGRQFKRLALEHVDNRDDPSAVGKSTANVGC